MRNEEQVMKNIIILSRELEDANSLPQMTLSFEKQTASVLIFTAILVYIEEVQSNIEKHLNALLPVDVTVERKEIIGYLKDGSAKNALVLRLQVAKSKDMFRGDLSVNVSLARQKIYTALCEVIGEIRDYDGGLLLKQQELFSNLQAKFPKITKEKKDFIENFFYGITPIEKQATLSLNLLETLFSLAVSSLQKNLLEKGSCFLDTQEMESLLFVFIRAEHNSILEYIKEQEEGFLLKKVISTVFQYRETLCIGYILPITYPNESKHFLDNLLGAIEQWRKVRTEKQVLRLSLAHHPISLNPGVGGDAVSKAMLQLLLKD